MQDAQHIPHVDYQVNTYQSWNSDIQSEFHVDLNLDDTYFMDCIIWLHQTLRLIVICIPATDVTCILPRNKTLQRVSKTNK